MYKVAIITVSDSGYAGERADLSGPAVRELMKSAGYAVVHETLLPDDRALLAKEMAGICDLKRADLILTTGGTGFSPRDVTPEATKDIAQRLAPGIPEAMRAASMRVTPRGMLSRAEAGIRASTLIINLPGSPKAAVECLEAVLPALGHGLDTLCGNSGPCGTPRS